MNASQPKLVNAATEVLTKCLAQVQEELAGVALDLLEKHPHSSSVVAREKLTGPPTPFIETIDALHQVVLFAPVDLSQILKSKACGAEDLWAITSGFLRILSSSNGTLPVLCFDVTDRHTGRTVPVALPAMHYNVLADDVNKFLRELKKFRKGIQGG